MKKFIISLSILAAAIIGENETFAQSKYDLYNIDPATKQSENAGWVTLGGRKNQAPIEVKFASGNQANKNDGGKTSMGQIKYDQKEGMLGLKLVLTSPRTYSAFTKKGNADWVSDGTWSFNSNKEATVVKFDAKSSDGGKTLVGKYSYFADGKNNDVDIKAVLQ